MYSFSILDKPAQPVIRNSLADRDMLCSFPVACFNFYDNGNVVEDAPVCGLTLRAGGSMRFRWNETNPVRDCLLDKVKESCVEKKTFVPVELNHTKIVYDISSAGDTWGKVGDGIITVNKGLVPVVTVADCVPIYIYDKRTGVFGVVHSGWKGTGIGAEAIKLAGEKYGSEASDFYVVIGPSIRSCCYIVNEERAEYFSRCFTPECISVLEEGASVNWNNGNGRLYRLALDKANRAMFRNYGVPDSHIAVCSDCTCCNDIFGSNRRETGLSGRPDSFTVMAAFILA